MVGAFYSTGWTQAVRAVLVAVVLLCGLSLVPGEASAQENPTWPAFPATIEAARSASFTQAVLDAVTCSRNGGTLTSCTGTERGTGVAMSNTCSLRGDGSANWCQLSFADKRYIIRLNNRGFTDEVGVEITEDTSGEVDPDAPERPPEGWTCSPSTVGQFDCTCTTIQRGGSDSSSLLCTSPYVTGVTDLDPGAGGRTDTVRENEDGTLTTTSTAASDDSSCGILSFNLGKCLQDIIGKIGASILLIFVSLLGILLGLFGTLFNWIVLVTVFQYSTYFGNSEGLLIAWSVLRDLGNILLLFGFIFIGLQTILNIGHFSVGKALPRLLIFAILINFSLFVSSAIIDVSNVFSAAFYTSAGGVNCGGAGMLGSDGTTPEECTGEGISGKILAAAGLGNVFDGSGGFGEIWGAGDGMAMMITYFGLLLLFIVMLIVFIAACIMLLIRAITLMFLVVLSPLGFAATAIPQFEEYSKMWWNSLLSQAFFAPMFLLMLFVGLKIMDGAKATFNANGASLTTAFASGDANTGGIFMLFFLIIGFMIGSLMVAKKMGAMGANFATQKAGGAVLGGMGFLGRRTGGMAGSAAAGAIAKNRAKIKRVIGSGNTLALYGAAKGLTEKSFDPRTGAPGTMLKSATGLDFGKPGKAASHGIHGIEEQEEKKRKDFADKLKLDKDQLFALQQIQKTMEAQRLADKTEADRLKEQHAGEREPLKNKIQEQRELAERTTGAGKQAAEERLGDMLREYDILMREQGEAKQSMETEQKNRMATLQKQEKDAKNAAKISYVADLNRPKFYPPLSIGTHVDHAAAEAIDKKINQSDADKILEKLDKVSEKVDKGGGGSAAPAAGGGGGDHH